MKIFCFVVLSVFKTNCNNCRMDVSERIPSIESTYTYNHNNTERKCTPLH